MKYQLLFWSLIIISLTINTSSKNQSKAEPAGIFQPIIEDIRTQIPSNLRIRLPAFIPDLAEDKEIELYSFIPDRDLNFFSMGSKDLKTFTVMISDAPDCTLQKDPLDCVVGIVGVSEISAQFDLELDDLSDDDEIEDLTPVELNQSAKGFYFIQHQDYQLVVWKQDRLAHLLIAEKCHNACLSKQDLIDLAKSAANEPAIVNYDSSYYSY